MSDAGRAGTTLNARIVEVVANTGDNAIDVGVIIAVSVLGMAISALVVLLYNRSVRMTAISKMKC